MSTSEQSGTFNPDTHVESSDPMATEGPGVNSSERITEGDLSGQGTSPDPAALDEGTSETQSHDDGETPNVVLSKDREEDALPEGLTNIGTVGIILPDVEAQKAGFYLPQEQASRLVSQFRQFKFLVKKGQDTPSVRIGE